MLGPNHHTYHVVRQQHDERLAHAARIRTVQQGRRDGSKPFHLEGHRAITARRLAAGLAGAVVAAALAAGTVGTVAASPSQAGGGGPVLIR